MVVVAVIIFNDYSIFSLNNIHCKYQQSPLQRSRIRRTLTGNAIISECCYERKLLICQKCMWDREKQHSL